MMGDTSPHAWIGDTWGGNTVHPLHWTPDAGTGGAGYSRVHRGDEPRGIARGFGDFSVPDWCGLNPDGAG